MDDTTFLRTELGGHGGFAEDASSVPNERTSRATEKAVTGDRYRQVPVSSPANVETIMSWAREAARAGLCGPGDPGTLPGIMADKRPPRRRSEPMAEPRPA